MEAVSLSEGRRRLFELRDYVVNNDDAVVMTHKNGNVVLIPMSEWEAYRETYRLLRDKEALRALLASFDAHDTGETQGKTPEEVFEDLL
ncbi:MAG: type II toxin-antitoxin system prevent-host-death family antitoxin [Chloroflexi bacterium]|nr:type II toxin-antitoxin system prevent-host-death family antitoxin [Chloroflexota bacterium]MBP8059239.1 type II toxin-antitoxin system prevent-host-death family antitoxin [Chloroflexota bacterium]